MVCSFCKKTFISNYFRKSNTSATEYFHFRSFQQDPKQINFREFDSLIKNLSNEFVNIYIQAEQAEKEGLLKICGMAYRKALEFLIKDYLISKLKSNEEKELIKNKFLGKCIEEDIKDPRIKEMAKRANWLGNDETHYIRKYEDKDLEDLKKLIEITIHFISIEKLSENYKNDIKKID